METPTTPLLPAGDGRGPNGRFLPGNRAGRGNPLAKKAQQLRVGLMQAVKPGDLRAVILKLVELGKGGDVAAAKLLFDRVLGPAVEVDLIERLEKLEEAVLDRKQ